MFKLELRIFTILISDLVDYIHSCKSLLFAKGLKMSKHIRNNDTAHLHIDLDHVYQWRVINKITLNTLKSWLLTFTRYQNFIRNNYYLNGISISKVTKVKDLDIHRDHTLSFNCHIELKSAYHQAIIFFCKIDVDELYKIFWLNSLKHQH